MSALLILVVLFVAYALIVQAWEWMADDPLDEPLSDDWTPPA